ncbi:MAG TPA: cytochrome d ubiquinol oxidase subunit II [Candidatus Dormibacteraeota bacterium]|nr:cytochrome d ubiquinol oxidase subunit II [Candidatus Dormibacteraeota bacterium]
METVWFVLVSFMLVAYVVLDGFDLGAGIIHLLIARNDDERRMVLRAIGPVWDGNEVWLIASGGTLFFAFPLLYASSFSGFYLPLNIVLWLLVLRGVGIEFRMHLDNQVWRDFFDGLFSIGSLLLAIFFGAALGNVIRGVPLSKSHYFFEPLWTNFRPGANAGVLDWYTVLSGIVALVALTIHGAHYVAIKTEGNLAMRSRKLSQRLWPALLLLTLMSLIATIYVRPQTIVNYREHPVGFLVPALVIGSLGVMFRAQRSANEARAFWSSCVYLTAMLGGAAFALYPVLLPSSTPGVADITIYNAAAGQHALKYGLIWWSLGMLIAVGYVILIYRMFRGKVSLESGSHG